MSNNTNLSCVFPTSNSTGKTQSILLVRGSTLTHSAPVVGVQQKQPPGLGPACTKWFMGPVEQESSSYIWNEWILTKISLHFDEKSEHSLGQKGT